MRYIYRGLSHNITTHKYLEIQGKIYAPISTTGIILPCGSGLGYGGVYHLGVYQMTISGRL